MLKGLVTWFLNNYLGKYLENLNADQLSIALLQGEVELENIPLRKDALRFVDPSLEVVNGVVGRVKLKIPVSRLRSEPWSILMEKVYVVIAPQKHDDYDELQDDALLQEIKLSALDGIESDWRAKHDTEQYYPSYTSWMSFGTSLIGTIVDNLQVEICDVHLRYEDAFSVPSQVMACGLSLSLSAQSCDANWTPKFVQREAGIDMMAFKLIELQNMSVYVNSDTESFQCLSHEDLLRKMSTSDRAAFQANEYIIHPVCANALVKRNCAAKPLNSRKSPRIACEIELGSIEVDIKDVQYQSCVVAGRTLHQLHKNRKFWKWRPHDKPVKGNVKAWWQYAITCHMEEIHGRHLNHTWEIVLSKARENVAYVEAFKRHLQNPVVLDQSDKDVKEELDSSRPYEELKILREQAVILLEKEMAPISFSTKTKEKHETGRSETVGQSVLQGWFPMWWGWYDYAPQAEEASSNNAYSEKNESLLEDELLGVLADEAATNVVAYKDVVFLSSTVCLNKSLVKLFRSADDDSKKEKLLFELECSQAKLEFEHRPRTMSNKISLSLEAIYARDHVTPDTVFPLLISPQSAQGAPLFPKKVTGFGLSHLAKTFQSYMGSNSGPGFSSQLACNPPAPIFYLLYEKKPFGLSKTDYRLHIKSQPLNIVYNPAVMNFLQDFFKIPEGLNRTAQLSQKIRDAALHRMEEVKAKTKEEVRKNLSKLLLDDSNRTLWKKSWDLMLDLSAPQIIIPEHFVDKEALLLVVDLGKLHLDNSVQKSKSSNCNQDTNRKPPPSTQHLFPYFASSTKSGEEETDSEDEEFVTPASSPNTPDIKSDEENKNMASPEAIEEETVKFKMYETFSVNLTNMQVIIGRMKDNWRNAHVKGASSLHILDKFSIALQLQRRTVPTDDVDMPKFALSGTLPKLSMHINESKIQAVNRMAELLLHNDDDEEEEVGKAAKNGRCVSTQTPTTLVPSSLNSNEYSADEQPMFDSTQFQNEASMLILVYFCINDFSIELQSLEKSIVELQLQGVKASLTRRTEETNLGLSVHSLLLVDAIQTLGPNFELLVASHKNVSVDSISGSLRGSDPVSPCSPVSPNPAAAAAVGSAEKVTNPAEIAKALSALQRNKSSSQIGGGGPSFSSSHAAHSMSAMSQFAIDAVDPDALISIDVTLFNSTIPSSEAEAMQIISIQFNSLDVIANQETIIELLSFAKRVMPPELSAQDASVGCRPRRQFPKKDQIVQTDFSSETFSASDALVEDNEEEISDLGSKIRMHRTEVTADFQRLNVLLLRAVTGRMIGTALLTEARVYAELSDESVVASGSLGGLQVNSLLPGSQLHQRIVSVGKDPAAEEIKRARASVHSELYHQFGMKNSNVDKEMLDETDVQAFSFKIGYKSIGDSRQSRRQHAIDLEVKMASVCYLHSTPFIRELKSCATDFLHFLQQLASTIKMAATDLALGIVQRRTESLSRQVDMNDIYWSPLKYGSLKRSSLHKRQVPVAKDLFSSDEKISSPAPAPTPHAKGQHGKQQSIAGEVEVSIDIHLETPIVVLPRDERSNQVLVGHLGLITIKNEAEEHSEFNGNQGRLDRVLVKIEKMNVQCLDLMRQIKSHFRHKSSLDIDNLELMSMAKSLTAIELYSDSAQAAGEPILHNTEVAINIERMDLPAANSSMMESTSYHSFAGDYLNAEVEDLGLSSKAEQQHSFNIHGQVINPLKISLHRGQYCQILETLSTLIKKDNDHQPFIDQVGSKGKEKVEAKHVPVNGSFLVPMLQLELCSESAGTASSKGQALVSVRLEDFAVGYDNSEKAESTTQVTLGSIIAEDLSMPSDSPHRILATSIGWQNSNAQNHQGGLKASSSGLSTSCPRLATIHPVSSPLKQRQRSDSLPERLNQNTSCTNFAAQPRQVPLTPPPSLCPSGQISPTESGTPIAAAAAAVPNLSQQREGNLVLVKIVNVISEDRLDFEGIHRYVDVDFNTLDIVFSLQSWVIILDFFGIGSPSGSSEPASSGGKYHQQSNLAPTSSSKPIERDKHFNSDIKIKVRSLSVLLNHSDYEVARASVNSYVSRLSLHQGNFSLQGSLRKFLVTDLTKDGELYRDRFLSMQGQEKVLTFNFFKYGHGLSEKEEYDASLKLRMASIIYVHTQRFYSELLAFFNHFHQHQNVMNRIRVAALGESVNETASRGMRLKLDIEAGSPLLLLPLSSKSPRMLVVHLGFLRVFNTFKLAGEDGTISAQTLRSALSNHLLISRERRRRRSSSRSSRSTVRSISRRRSGGGLKSPGEAGSMGSNSRHRRRRRLSPLQHLGVTSNSEEENEDGVSDLPQAQESHLKCLLDVMSISLSSMDLRTADRLSVFTENLQKEDIVVGGFIVRQNADFRVLLQEKCELQLQVERNLDKAFNHQVPDISLNGSLSRVHATVDEKQYALIRGLLAHNLGENLDDLAQFLLVSVPTNEYQDPSMQTLLSGLARTCLYLNLELKDVILDLHHDDDDDKKVLLARVSFVHSVLTYESFSDSSRDVDLVSREILLNDVRYTDLPMNKRPSVFPHILQPLITDDKQQSNNQNNLQAEVHFRLSPDTHRITVLVNNMRLLGIFDWWFQVLDFISTNESPPPPQSEDEVACSKSKATPPGGEEWPNSNRALKSSAAAEEPLYPSAGIISRRAPQVVKSQGPVFELKLNITDCDFIIIADPSRSDSTAIILRSTTVLAYRPDMVDRPFSCNLNNAEVFSCTLGKENETALSIIDPVTINFEIAGRNVPGMPLKGLSDFLVLEQNKDGYNQLGTYERTAEIQLQQLNVRLSHNDWLVFHKILNSFPHQASNAAAAIGKTNVADHQLLGKLMDLGFPSSSCEEALTVCNGHLDEAALWLTQHCQPMTDRLTKPKYFLEGTNVSFTSFECKISQINICIIDDCRDADVPLVDFSLQRIHFCHDFEQIGQASSILSSSYYNRSLSAWEPLMEPWKCSVGWKLIPIGQADAKGQKLVCTFEAEDPVHFNVTSTLLDLYHQTKKDWTTDIEEITLHSQIRGSTRLSKRMPFVPFAIRNETGLRLWFSTRTKTRYRSSSALKSTCYDEDGEEENWQEVEDGGEIQFSFESKSRNKKSSCSSNEISFAHQIIVRVEGWEEVSPPVSIDKVGTFFRNANTAGGSLPPVRVVFDVSIKDTALKLVTVRSALLVENKLEFDVQLRLENTTLQPKDIKQMTLAPGQRKCVGLKHVWAKMVVRPQTSASKTDQWKFSDKSIEWYHILSASENELKCHTCPHLWRPAEIPPQQFCVAVRRLNYPSDTMAAFKEGERGSGRKSVSVTWIQPAHVITFLPPVVIINLLPCHLNFRLKSEKQASSMVVAPGKESFVLVNLEEEMIFEFFLDNFPGRGEISLPAATAGSARFNFVCRLQVRDYGHRPLDLIGRVEASYGGAIRISIFARHWLVNKTGLPLIFRQEGLNVDAAGQEEANELARLAAPLMFSFDADHEETGMSESKTHLTMRVGSGLHAEDTPQWCRSFPLQPGSRVRKLFVHPKDSGRVSRIYIIGVDGRVGKGRYRETLIITFSPRFQVHNQTSYKMQMSQRCFATTFTDLEAQASHLQAYPASCLAFHWPRLDRDQLLCLRLLMDINGQTLSSLWSGGIVIDKVDSFHLAVRTTGCTGIFVRVEVSLVGATFVTILTDAANFPPPFRIDNFSQVSLACHQSGVSDENLKTVVKAHQSVPYAWDEPSLPPHITCIAPGGSNASYNLNVIGEGSPLTYENFIFIQMAAMESNLVFDVEGTRVYLAPKEAGKRSQLWRMTSSGMLQHEGSSPPQDPKFSSSSHNDHGKSLVLDIAGPAVQPHTYVPLMLRKPEERRQLTQKWRFTEDGRLMCAHRGLYVQAKDGFCGLKKGNDLVLGPTQPVTLERTSSSDVPIEQAITRQRMRPGSGNLSIRVSTDGPTRVLQVVDINKSGRSYAKWDDRQWIMANENLRITDDEQLNEQVDNVTRGLASGVYETQVLFTAKKGIGLSLICHEPSEEILLAYMSNVVIDYQDAAEHSSLDGSIGNIQIDNQLWDAHYPVILFVSPATRSDEYRHMPAITFTVDRMKTHQDDACKDAEIFKHLMVQIKNVTLNLEEELLCKVFKFAGITRSDEEMERLDENAHETVINAINAPAAKRFYFGTLKLALNQVKLSVSKSLKLSRDLEAVKTKLGLSLIAFEDALIDLDPFIRVHPFETMAFLSNAVVKHYTDELLSQAVLILGATDFLGNPIGFFNDITEGVSGLVSEGDVGGLIKNVAHGAANSAAKVTGSLSYGISKATVYDKYNEKRLMLRRCGVGGTKPRGGNTDRSKEYLVDGLKGLGFGVFQGLTSIVTETYEGVANDGFSGLFSGLTWGLIGTVSKPALGVLDLATGAATAVKESSRSRRQELPAKIRPSRLVMGLGGVLPIYHRQEALGQELLYRLNGHDINEIYIGHELLRAGPEEHLQLLISSARILVFARMVVPSSAAAPLESSTKNRIMMNVSHAELVCAQSVKTGGGGEELEEDGSQAKFYVELVGKFEEDNSMETTHKRPRVRCDTQILSQQVAQKINLAIDMFEEMTQAVIDNEEQLKQQPE